MARRARQQDEGSGGIMGWMGAWWGARRRSRMGHLLLFSIPVWPLLVLGLWLFFYFWAFSKIGPPVSEAASVPPHPKDGLEVDPEDLSVLSTTRLLHRGRCFQWDLRVTNWPKIEPPRVLAKAVCKDLLAGSLPEVRAGLGACGAYDQYVPAQASLQQCVVQLEQGVAGMFDWLARHDPRLLLVPITPAMLGGNSTTSTTSSKKKQKKKGGSSRGGEEAPLLYLVSVLGQSPGLETEAIDLCGRVLGITASPEFDACRQAVVKAAQKQLADKQQQQQQQPGLNKGTAHQKRSRSSRPQQHQEADDTTRAAAAGSEQQQQLFREEGEPDVAVFWHVGVLDNEVWRSIVMEQLHALIDSGLADRAHRVVVSVVGGSGGQAGSSPREQARQPLAERPHPHIRLWEGGPVPALWQHEWPTLDLLYDHCRSARPGAAVLYLNNKGASRAGQLEQEHLSAWRRFLQEFSVRRWPACLAAVTTHNYSTCGVQYDHQRTQGYAGNVWWASCRYVRTLMPLDDVPRFSRHSAAHWIGSSVAERRPLSCLQLYDEDESTGQQQQVQPGGRLLDLFEHKALESAYRDHPGCDSLLQELPPQQEQDPLVTCDEMAMAAGSSSSDDTATANRTCQASYTTFPAPRPQDGRQPASAGPSSMTMRPIRLST